MIRLKLRFVNQIGNKILMTTLTNPNIYKISTVYKLLFLDIKSFKELQISLLFENNNNDEKFEKKKNEKVHLVNKYIKD